MVEPFRFESVKVSHVNLQPAHDVLGEVYEAMRKLARASLAARDHLIAFGTYAHDARLADVLGVPTAALIGVRVQLASAMPDGRVYVARLPPLNPGPDETVIFIGTYRRPAADFRPSLDDVAEEARLIVRRGMTDELEWLGQDPEWLGTTEQILDLLRSGSRNIPIRSS